MITVNSISGGKTSSYIAMHYPADYDVFALVTVEDRELTPKDKGLVKTVSDKIGREFIGTVESDLTIKVVLDLEQMIGREITWVVGDTFEEVIRHRGSLPNQFRRFCTTDMKMTPIFNWWLQNVGEVCSMRIGFRLDEFERAERFTTTYKYPLSTNTFGQKRKNWKEIEWRVGEFPLIDDKPVTHYEIQQYWDGKDLIFPNSSNCVGCFWKPERQLRQNWEEEPLKMTWFDKQEQKTGYTFRKQMSMSQIKKMGLQQSMFWGGGSCQSEGYCTD